MTEMTEIPLTRPELGEPTPQPERQLDLLSVVTPAYNEAASLATLHARLRSALAAERLEWEWVGGDSLSRDEAFAIVTQLAAQAPRIRGIRLARNEGSHTAIACGLADALGNASAVLAADLQDPPEGLPRLVERWADGAQVVWAGRESRADQPLCDRLFARLYYWLLRRTVEVGELPPSGADCFLLDRLVIDALSRFTERQANLPVLVARMGFRQVAVPYLKGRRAHGRSGWSLRKKLELAIDTFTVFSHLPVRLMLLFGFATGGLSFLYALEVVVNAFRGHRAEGWRWLTIALLVIGGTQLLMMGVLGEYLWRTMDENRRRRGNLVEARTPPALARGERGHGCLGPPLWLPHP